MSNLNTIGLDKDKSSNLAEKLNILLANYSIFYQNTRGYHWNIQGKEFFELHVKFEELYTDLIVKIDEVAERILTLGETPEHAYANYYKTSTIKVSGEVTDGIKGAAEILESLQILIKLQREILDMSGELGDEGTNALMSDYISEQEKLVWMYSSFLKQ